MEPAVKSLPRDVQPVPHPGSSSEAAYIVFEEDKLYKTGEIRFRPSKITTVALEWPCIAAGEYTYASTTSQFFPLSVASSGPVAGKTLEAIRDMFCRSTDIIRSVRGYSPVRGCVVLDIHRHDLVEKGAATITDMQVPATARR